MFIEHNAGYHTTSVEPHRSFLAMYQGRGDGLQEVTNQGTLEYGPMMCIGVDDGVVYITREQAKAFFGFTD